MNIEKHDKLNPLRKQLDYHIKESSDLIFDKWVIQLRDKFETKADPKIRYVSDCRKQGTDLVSIFFKVFLSGADCTSELLHPIFKRIWALDYSISDFFAETECLRAAFFQYLGSANTLSKEELFYGFKIINQEINELFSKVLNECSLLFEHIAENSKTGFCHTDSEGRITFANREMLHLSGRESLTGYALEDLFNGDEKNFVRVALQQNSQFSKDLRALSLKSENGRTIPVGIEIGPVTIKDEYKGGYAHITNISKPVELQNKIFDRALMGIIKLDLKGNITFANKSMLQLVGMENWRNRSVKGILPNRETWDLVKKKLGERIIDGHSDEYDLIIKRVTDQQQIPVKVSAFPETDLSGKRIIGSFAIIRNIVADKIHQHIETHRNENALLEAVAEELRVLIPFDLMAVSEYSADMHHLRSFFSFSPGSKPTWERRWWKMTPARIKWANQQEVIIVDDLDTFFRQNEWKNLREEPDIKWLFKNGFCSFLFYPITMKNKLVAAVTLMIKSCNVYQEHHKALIERKLPLDMAVHMALYYHQKREMAFATKIIGYISGAGSNVWEIRNVIVNQLADHYDWESVSLFKIDEIRKKIVLLDQAAVDEKFQFPNEFEQDLNEGVLGYVFRKKEIVNIGDVYNDPKFKNVYCAAIQGKVIRSELCLPIKFGEVQWLLNVEASHINAFSKEEERAIQRLVDEVQRFFEKSWLSHFLEASLGATSDAILVVNSAAEIVQANPAAIDTFDIEIMEEPDSNHDMRAIHKPGSIARVTPKPLRDLFHKPAEADGLVKTRQASKTSVTLKTGDGDTIPMLLSSVDLNDDFGYFIVAAADLSAQKRVEEIENLGKVFFEIGIQTKTPLSLAYGWLSRLKRQMPKSGRAHETLDKVVRQLGKLELTYNRLVLYSADQDALPYNGILLDIAEVLDEVRADLPKTETEKINWQYPKGDLHVHGDLFQLRFCFETLLSHLLRFVPQDSQIGLRVIRENDDLSAEFSGWRPQNQPQINETETTRTALAKALLDMAFGEKVIRTFIIDNHGGKFWEPVQDGEAVTFRFTLPLVED
jgi:PAS domain S-box-containing protein